MHTKYRIKPTATGEGGRCSLTTPDSPQRQEEY